MKAAMDSRPSAVSLKVWLHETTQPWTPFPITLCLGTRYQTTPVSNQEDYKGYAQRERERDRDRYEYCLSLAF